MMKGIEVQLGSDLGWLGWTWVIQETHLLDSENSGFIIIFLCWFKLG